ncbi:Crp/Fnr family transcriptional regulator [Thiothrix subterranea]|uniref:Crp/Fnr family transcriptional regulator n=1 Tax=Thiothrix subterranea TaxID=2735563 RepID=A0AA51MRD6_9GAMM|nr:Crp/Fnr family transcriptional regulator [Thiothrix subterranea]MDQ5769736.1 Crp/Fnr family transcriptional regulator [Thiothrix subterranea]QQZ29888.1 Crp/Fnr family transcriptional regulator [Thiothrix subterranea]WML88529.1 Crp/Fnr family transcriptional regulator [Thiothrix subterranea]
MTPTKLTVASLRKVSLLEGLDDVALGIILKQLTVRRYEKRDIILQKGATDGELLFLLAGQLHVVDYTLQGKEVFLHVIQPGDYFGELSVIDGAPRSASIVAIKESVVAFLSKRHALNLFYNYPSVIERLLIRFAQVIRQASGRQMLLSIPSAHARVYVMLARMVRSPDLHAETSTVTLENVPTQQEIAGMVNTTRETVSRAMQTLVKEGIIKRDKRKIVVLQPEVLEERAMHGEGSLVKETEE